MISDSTSCFEAALDVEGDCNKISRLVLFFADRLHEAVVRCFGVVGVAVITRVSETLMNFQLLCGEVHEALLALDHLYTFVLAEMFVETKAAAAFAVAFRARNRFFNDTLVIAVASGTAVLTVVGT